MAFDSESEGLIIDGCNLESGKDDSNQLWNHNQRSEDGDELAVCVHITYAIQFVFTLAIAILGIFCLTTKDLKTDSVLVYYYIVGCLTADIILGLVALLVLLCIYVTFNNIGVAYCVSSCALLHSFLQASIYYISAFVGLWLLYTGHAYKVSTWVCTYIILEVFLSLIFTFQTFPIVLAGVAFLFICVKHLFTRSDAIPADSSSRSRWYLDDSLRVQYRHALATMSNPMDGPNKKSPSTKSHRKIYAEDRKQFPGDTVPGKMTSIRISSSLDPLSQPPSTSSYKISNLEMQEEDAENTP